MANRTGIVRFTGKLNNANDVAPGGPSPDSLGWVPGMVGIEIEVDAANAAALSDTTVATLRSGRYRYVKSLSTGTTAPARGRLAIFSTTAQNEANIVHSDGAAADDGRVVGVFLNTVTKGNCTWVQVAGIADVLFGTVTSGTDGNLVTVSTGTATANAIADATAATDLVLKGALGVAVGTATSAQISAVLLKGLPIRAGGN